MMEMKARILIADDDVNFTVATSTFLMQHGYHCDHAATGEEALLLLKQTPYDLLLSDIEMPGNSDLGLIRDLDQMQIRLPVILITGHPSVQTAAYSVGLSVIAYLIKPVAPEVLLSEIARAIELSRCFRHVAGTHQRLLSLCQDLKQVETAFRIPANKDFKASVAAFLDLTMQNVVSSLLDLRQLFEIMVSVPGQLPEMDWLQSARPLILINALRETIAALAKTKRSFHSKELAELRRKLESLLQEQSGAEPESIGAMGNDIGLSPLTSNSDPEIADRTSLD